VTIPSPGCPRRRAENAKQEYEAKVGIIGKENAELEKRAQAKDERWQKLKDRLQTVVRRAGD
jgi:hypothetical protein